MRIIVFGDSIAYGSWDVEGGWVERLKKRAHVTTLQSRGSNKVQVINLGIGGDTSTKLLSRIESEIVSRRSANWPFLFIIAIGTNDGRMVDGMAEVSIEKYKENIDAIITLAKAYTDKLLVVGLPPIGAETLNFKGQIYTDDTVKAYDNALKDVATHNGITYVPLRPLFEKIDANDLFCYDLLHPSDRGHRLIADEVDIFLKELGIELSS